MTWLWIVGFIVGYLSQWRAVARWVLEDSLDPPGVDLLIATVGTLMWPVIAAVRLLGWIYRLFGGASLCQRVADFALSEPRSKRKRRELAEREDRIAALEAELGISVLEVSGPVEIGTPWHSTIQIETDPYRREGA